jgi:hypothetical protein
MALPIKPQDTQEGCNPISSNCVIWQGPDIPCLSLCNGDSVSDVVAKLAYELCTIMDELKLSAYDLTCFDPICPTPTNFQSLIQLLIDKVCALYNVPATSVTAGCPDCEVTVAPCLVTLDNLGNQITTLQLKDYVILIGNKICTILTDIASQGTAISNLDSRVTYIENNCCNANNVPVIATSCVTPTATNIPITNFVVSLENAFCALEGVTGTVSSLQAAIGQQCVRLGAQQALNPDNSGENMSDLPGWIGSPTTVADTLNNMWLTICDMRAGLVDLISQVNACCAVSCSSITGAISNAIYDGSKGVSFFFPVSFPSGWSFGTDATYTITGCNPASSPATGTIALSNTSSNSIDLSGNNLIFYSLYWNLTLIAYYTDGDKVCTDVLQQFSIPGPITCPALTISAPAGTAGDLKVDFNASISSTYQVGYTVIVYNSTTNASVGSQIFPAGSTGTLSLTLHGLDTNTYYYAKIFLSQGSCAQTEACNTSTSIKPTQPTP